MTANRAQFPASRCAALAQWESFLPHVPEYASRRNYVIEGHPHVSCLSPAIRGRLITEEEILKSLRQRFTFSSVEKFVQELLWRGYWKAWLECHPGVWADYKRQIGSANAALLPEQAGRVQAIQMAKSGIAVIDLFTQELIETGYLHNHARMWWASYWVHVEKLPWQLGADFFYRHLIDGDAASNTLSWRWVAGLQTSGKTYLVRRSNIEKFLSPKLLAQVGLEKLEDNRVETAKVTDAKRYQFALPPTSTGPPTLAGTRWGLWLHDEDLNPESLNLPDSAPASIRAFTQRYSDEPLNSLSPQRQEYIRAILQDGILRAASHWNLGCNQFAIVDAPCLADALINWAHHENLDAIALSRPAVGFLGDQIPGVLSILDQIGIKLVTIVRSWDKSLYPHAQGSFFKFWEPTKAFLCW